MTLPAEQYIGAPNCAAAGIVEPGPAVTADPHHRHPCSHDAEDYSPHPTGPTHRQLG